MPEDTDTEENRGTTVMHKETGAVATFETKTDAEAAGYTVPLSQEQYDMALHMNRKQRRAWAAQQRGAKKKPVTP
jgi:hypothetical protein